MRNPKSAHIKEIQREIETVKKSRVREGEILVVVVGGVCWRLGLWGSSGQPPCGP